MQYIKLTTTIGHLFFIEIARNHSKHIFNGAQKHHSHLHDDVTHHKLYRCKDINYQTATD